MTPGDKESLCAATEKAIRNGGATIEQIPDMIRRIIEVKAWEERDVKHVGIVRMKSLRDLITRKPLEGWGTTIEKVQKLIEHDPDLLATWRETITPEKHLHHEKNKSDNDNIIIKSDQGTSRSYTVTRLKRDHPEIFERVVSGEISANAGAIEAGFRKKCTPLETALNAYAKLTEEEKTEFKTIIS